MNKENKTTSIRNNIDNIIEYQFWILKFWILTLNVIMYYSFSKQREIFNYDLFDLFNFADDNKTILNYNKVVPT